MTQNQELELWKLLKREANDEVGRTVRIAKLGEQQVADIDMERTAQIVRTWSNRGLVIESHSGRYASLTEAGADMAAPRIQSD